MDPTSFIGVPDWRSALLALVLTLPWLWLLARRHLDRPAIWLVVVVAAVLFPLSIALIQVPIQQAYSSALLATVGLELSQANLIWAGFPSVLVSGLVQEVVKLLIAVLGIRLLGGRVGWPLGLAVGAAAGAGYGGFEAFWVFNLVFGQGWSWGTVQLAGVAALLPFYERLVTVPFHIGAAALSVHGFSTGRVWRFLLLAIALHTAANWSVLFIQAGAIGMVESEIWVTAVAVLSIGLALWIRYRRREAAASLQPEA